MMEEKAMTIEERVNQLERALNQAKRTNHFMLIALVVLVLVAVGLTQFWRIRGEPENELHAERFVLRDQGGRGRAILGTHEGQVGLLLFDASRTPRSALTVGAEGASLNLRDERGAVRVNLGAWKDAPSLALHDENGTTRARLHAHKVGPSLDLQDENGTLRAVVAVGPHGPRLRLIDQNDKWRVGVEHNTTDDQARVIVGDKQGKIRWSAP